MHSHNNNNNNNNIITYVMWDYTARNGVRLGGELNCAD